ncbi:MAG TPA: discoidin domain-containing protein, partial [Beutenbergiaceae bacterium]|nr:discoidin domain-containing protein [Beutenbergiaceae bacterium]
EMLPDGRLAIFVARHTVSLTMFTAPQPHDPSGMWSQELISTDKTTYPEPVVIGSDIYVFYSHNTSLAWPYRQYRYIASADNGATWSEPEIIIDTGRTDDRFSEVYVLSADPIADQACLTWTLAGGRYHNAQARDLYAACFDPATGTLTSLDGVELGAVVDEADHAAAKVIDAPTTAAVPRPMNLAALTQDPASGNVFIGAGYHKDGLLRIEVGEVIPGTGIPWTTVDTGTRSFLDITWNSAAGGAEVLSVDGTQTDIRTHVVTTGGVSLLSEHEIPYGNTGADAVWVGNFVEERAELSYVAYTINVAQRDSNYSGTWPVFASWAQLPPLPDVAEGKSATAHSVKNDNPERTPDKAVDGDPTTRWGSEYVDDAWLEVDLGVTTHVDAVRLNWEAAYGKDYDIQVSDDGATWHTVRAVRGATGGVDELTNLDATGRYIRMQGIERGTRFGYSLWDFHVLGQPVDFARGRPATASSISGNNPYRAASNATDGHSGTRWASAYVDPSWITVDLGELVAISEVHLNWEYAFGSEYEIQVSHDGTTWTTLYTTTTGSGRVEKLTGLTGEGRYVRLLGLQRGTPYGYSLWDLEVYGSR